MNDFFSQSTETRATRRFLFSTSSGKTETDPVELETENRRLRGDFSHHNGAFSFPSTAKMTVESSVPNSAPSPPSLPHFLPTCSSPPSGQADYSKQGPGPHLQAFLEGGWWWQTAGMLNPYSYLLPGKVQKLKTESRSEDKIESPQSKLKAAQRGYVQYHTAFLGAAPGVSESCKCHHMNIRVR